MKRTESIGVPPLRDSNRLVSSNSGKANVLNSYLKSVFTAENTSTIPNKGTSPLPNIADISFTATGIVKQLQLFKPTYSSVTGITHSLGWDSLEKRRYIDSVTMMYKVVQNLVYIPLPNSVQPSYSRTRANHPYTFMHIFANSNAYKNSFFPRVISLRNSLPSFVSVCAESVRSFQAKLIYQA